MRPGRPACDVLPMDEGDLHVGRVLAFSFRR